MFGIDECAGTAFFLSLSNDAQSQSCFTGAFRTVDFDNTAAGHTADTEGQVQTEGAGGDGFNVSMGVILSESHNGAFSEGFFNLA